MANTIRIKRRVSGAAGPPSSLANAELAFNEVVDVLYYGKGGTASAASSVIAVAGSGAFATLDTTQTLNGDKTFAGTVDLSGTATTLTKSQGDNSTKIASTAYVDTAVSGLSSALTVVADSGSNEVIDLGSETLTVAGGTALTSTNTTNTVTVSLDNTAVSAGVYGAANTIGTFTVDAQGRLTAASDTSISILAAAVTDFNTQVRTSRLDQMAAPTADVSFGANKLTGVSNPTQDQDAATKAYVDNVATGLDVKASVYVATTANITLSGNQTIDGFSLIDGDRVLVKDQTTGSENGIYICSTSAWSRSTDADNTPTGEVTSGMFTFVEEGTNNGDTGWVLTTSDPITLNSTALSFSQFSGGGQVTAGTGLTKTGNTIDAIGTANRISVSTNAIDIDSNYVGQSTIDTLGTITTGTWNATVIDVLAGGTGANNAFDARTNLGLTIGTDVQAYDTELDTLSNMGSGVIGALALLSQQEIEVISGSTSATSVTLISTDTFVLNYAGTMVQVALSDLVTFLEDETTSGFNVDGGSY